MAQHSSRHPRHAGWNPQRVRWLNTLLAWMRGRAPGPHQHSHVEHAVPVHAADAVDGQGPIGGLGESLSTQVLQETESALGQSDWRDPETGELAQDTRLHRPPDQE